MQYIDVQNIKNIYQFDTNYNRQIYTEINNEIIQRTEFLNSHLHFHLP